VASLNWPATGSDCCPVASPTEPASSGQSPSFWIYLVGAAFVGAGFADFPLIAYHFQKSGALSQSLVPIFYAIAMGVGGAGSLLFGRLFDRKGIIVLVPLTMASALYAPFAVVARQMAAAPDRPA